jgi:hypothetical protein
VTAEPISPVAVEVAAAAQESMQAAERLGARWGLRYGTITQVNSATSCLGVLDGDTNATPIPLISLIGTLTTTLRVAVITIPPSGNYVIASAGALGRVANVNAQVSANGSTASGVFANYPSPYTVTLTKLQTATSVLVRWAQSFFTDNAATGPEFGVQVTVGSTSTDYVTHNLPGTIPLNTRVSTFGERKISGIAAGALTITGRWRRFSGAGTISVISGADYASLTAEEVQ